MTRFIPSFATQQLLPPWHGDAEIYAFAFELPPDTIQHYVDRYLNSADKRGHKYFFTQTDDYTFGMLIYSRLTNIMTLPNHKNGDNPYTWDNVDFSDVGIYFPTSNRRSNAHNIANDFIQWCQPLAICDNPLVTFGAREIIGLDILPGNISAFSDKNPRVISAKLCGVTKFSPTSKEGEIEFLDIELSPTALKAANTINEGAEDRTVATASNSLSARIGMMQKILKLTDGKSLGDGCLPEKMDIIALKQFRDASNMNLAIYQALVEFQISRELSTEADKPNLSLIPENEVRITLARNDTTDEIVSTIAGLSYPDQAAPDPRIPVTISPTLAFRLKCRVVMDNVKTDVLLS